ncbi:MAG: PilZ domain-containing protein [Candidatus Zixiibacteriota bacterium]
MRIHFEQREFTRIPFRRTAEIVTDATGVVAEATRDISAKGLFVEGTSVLPPGSPCRVRLSLLGVPDTATIETEGRIVRAEPDGAAVEFTGMDLDSFHHLRNLVLYNAPNPVQIENEFENHLGLRRA